MLDSNLVAPGCPEGCLFRYNLSAPRQSWMITNSTPIHANICKQKHILTNKNNSPCNETDFLFRFSVGFKPYQIRIKSSSCEAIQMCQRNAASIVSCKS